MARIRGGKTLQPTRGKVLPERTSTRIAELGERSTGGRAPKRNLTGKVRQSKSKISKFDRDYLESEDSWDVQSQVHVAVPCITADGSISTNDKRVIEHTASPYLLAFLLDHSRGDELMMQYLRGNFQ